MVMTDEHLKEIVLRPRTSREYLDLMTMVVNLEHFYRKMRLDKSNKELPEVENVERLCKKFLQEWDKIKKKKKK